VSTTFRPASKRRILRYSASMLGRSALNNGICAIVERDNGRVLAGLPSASSAPLAARPDPGCANA
jgi:hypothetical protein